MGRISWRFFGMLFVFWLLVLQACGGSPTPPPGPSIVGEPMVPTWTPLQPEPPTEPVQPTPTLTPSPTPTPHYEPVRFAVIGDFGKAGPAEEAVADLIASWNPDFILTVGDNNYPSGSELTFDANVRAYYGKYIEEERFFPALGNHDWGYFTPKTLPFVRFFDYLPGNRRYYDFVWGPVHIFVLDSDGREPDGITPDSKQGRWLQEQLAASGTPWQIVAFHHAPYSSGRHGDTEYMQWPFAEWGVDLVLTGHDHTYERVHRDGLVYIVNGLGGAPNIYEFEKVTEGSQVRYNETHGALFLVVTAQRITGQFVNVRGEVVDEFTVP